MQLKKWTRVALIGCSILMLAACSTTRKNSMGDQTSMNDTNASYGDENAQSSGAGDETSFGDRATTQASNGRVYYFDFDSNVVRSGDKPAIVSNASKISATRQAKVMLEGNTDPRGSREYNIGLGERRSKAVAEVMTAQGVSPKQIRIVSYGAEKLASNGHTEEDYQKDRRVVLVYMQR